MNNNKNAEDYADNPGAVPRQLTTKERDLLQAQINLESIEQTVEQAEVLLTIMTII